MAEADLIGVMRELDQRLMEDLAAGDAAALVSGFYADDAVLMPPNAPRIDGADAIRGFWEALIRAGGDLAVETTEAASSGDLAYGIGTYSITIPGHGRKLGRDSGKYLIVLRRHGDGSWKTIADMHSSDRPG